MVQPALQDEPRRSRGVSGPSLAENRPKTVKNQQKSEYRIANEPLREARVGGPRGTRGRGRGKRQNQEAEAEAKGRGRFDPPGAHQTL